MAGIVEVRGIDRCADVYRVGLGNALETSPIVRTNVSGIA